MLVYGNVRVCFCKAVCIRVSSMAVCDVPFLLFGCLVLVKRVQGGVLSGGVVQFSTPIASLLCMLSIRGLSPLSSLYVYFMLGLTSSGCTFIGIISLEISGKVLSLFSDFCQRLQSVVER